MYHSAPVAQGDLPRELFGAVLDSSPDLIYVVDARTGELLHANRMDVQPAEEAAGHEQRLAALVAARPKSITRRSVMCRKDGSRFPVEIHARAAEMGGRLVIVSVARDMTEAALMREALHASEEQFRTVFRASPAAIAIGTVRDARYTEVNDSYVRLLGYSRDELVGRTVDEIGLWADAAVREALRGRLQRGESIRNHEGRLRRKSGEVVETLFSIEVVDFGGEPLAMATHVDITERKRAEQALRASEQRFKAFMDHSPAIAWIKDSELRYTYVSEPFLRQLRKTPQDVIGKTVMEVWPEVPESATMLEADRTVRTQKRPLQVIDSGILREDGSVSHWLVSKFPLPDETGAVRVGGVSLDITDRIETEREARALLDRLVSAQESERKRLATELHDLIGQNLTALAISLANLSTRVSDGQLELMRRTVEETIEAIRGVMAELRPAGLDEYGLLAALRAYAADFQTRTSLRTTVEARGLSRRLPSAMETSLFRIVQEALTNAAKHSGAAAVDVLLEQADGVLHLYVEDDGRGFREPQAPPGRAGWGLRAIRERAQACGGTLRIENPGRGTRLVVAVPLAQEARRGH
jgi:two-component system sensor histidine kinase UhpB